MPTADELISAASIRQLAAILRAVDPGPRHWPTVEAAAARLAPLGLSDRARAVCEAILTDMDGSGYPELADVVRLALKRQDLTGWMVWPVTEAVAAATTGSATGSGGGRHFEDGLQLLAELTPRLTSEFALRTFLNTDLERTLATVVTWTGDPDAAVRRLAGEGTRPKLPWARQVRALNRDPHLTVPILDRLCTDESGTVRRSVANHLNDISRLDPRLATAVATRWTRNAAATTPALVRHAMRTLVKKGDPDALGLVGFRGGRDALEVRGPEPAATDVRIGDEIVFTAHIRNTSGEPVVLAVDYVVHHLKANGQQAPKVFKLATRTLAPGEGMDIARRHVPPDHHPDLPPGSARPGAAGQRPPVRQSRLHPPRPPTPPAPTAGPDRSAPQPRPCSPGPGTAAPSGHTCLGTLPVMPHTQRITWCPGSEVGSNISGQPPSITVIPCFLP